MKAAAAMLRWTSSSASCFVAVLTVASAAGQSVAASDDDLDFFESKVRPLLVERCFECHSSALVRPKGMLVLDTRAGLLAGGVSGDLIVAGDPDASVLIEAVRYEGFVQMPPKGKLDDASIAVLVEWVRRGAPMPADDASPAPRERSRDAGTHWAFQPVSDPVAPEVSDELWCRNDVDRFVLARLDAAGISPAPEADRRTLLRRLSFDLIGLPPTAKEVEAFERDFAPDAWSRQIERLLASPHYGERWGRYWLDLARYSDSNGLDENLAMSNAWRYRDWVVRALNQDLSYDRFLTYQLAGDLLPEPDDEQQLRDQLCATGFLVLGPKMLAEQDKPKLVFDVVDEQLDVAFRTFNGLTLGCARCHDHKFDPVAQRDYYAVAGVFKSTATMANLNFVSRWNERELAPRAAVEARQEAVAAAERAKRELEELRRSTDDELYARWTAAAASYLLAGTHAARNALFLEAEDFSRGNLVRDDEQYGSHDDVIARTGKPGEQFAEYDLTFAQGGRQQLDVRMAAQESRPVRLLLNGAVVSEEALGETTGSWNPDGLRWFRLGTLEVQAGRNVLRIERHEGPLPHLDKLVLATVPEGRDGFDWAVDGNPWAGGLVPSIVRAWADRIEAAERRDDAILALWSRFAQLDGERFEERASALTDELRVTRGSAWNPLVLGVLEGLPPTSLRELAGRYQTLISSVDRTWRDLRARDAKAQQLDDVNAEALRLVVHGPTSPFRLPSSEVEALYQGVELERIVAAREELARLEQATPPEFERVLGVRDERQPADVPLMRRGSHLDPTGEGVPRGPIALFDGLLETPSIAPDESGRLQLARWMVDPAHPLTARVIANRLWQGHFSHGIVASSSNFGLRGAAPTHPELLDWLARELLRGGWSLKHLHRVICSSATYRMSASASAAALAQDPENRLLSRQNRRRLDAEALRDALLAVSGELDRTLGGSLLEAKSGEYVTNDQSKLAANFDAPRRALYLPIVRNAMLDLFSVFDYPDPSTTVEVRPQTTSPNQALYLMNSPLVISTSHTLAARSAGAAPGERVDTLYRSVLARAADAHERRRALDLVERIARPASQLRSAANIGAPEPEVAADEREHAASEAWRALAQVLLVSNEFLFVD